MGNQKPSCCNPIVLASEKTNDLGSHFFSIQHRTANVFNFLNKNFNDRVIALDYPTHTGSGEN